MTSAVDLLVVGGGPAGLAAAAAARRGDIERVLVVEREREVGGIPRHSKHTGFGVRDLHRLMTGPGYARELARRAIRAGAEIRTETSVVGWTGTRTVTLTGPSGIEDIEAGAIILTTGCRERPRTARLVAGNRPPGVFTTGSLQQLVYLHGQRLGERAVIVGAEHVSFSAVRTLSHGGARVAAMVTEHSRDQTYLPLRLATTTRLRVPIIANARVDSIVGCDRVEWVEVVDVTTGRRQRIACDTVVFSGDWIPENELARLGGVEIDPGTQGPRIDTLQRTSQPGVFAAGNLVHAAETADTASRCGAEAADAAADFLRRGTWPSAMVPIEVAAPLRWISPNAIPRDRCGPPHGHFLLRVEGFEHDRRLTVRQGDRELWARRDRRLVPERPIHAPSTWIRSVDPGGPPVSVSLI